MTLIFETEKYGRLWLGGEKAVHNTLLLSQNEVGYVWPACASAVPETPQVYVFDTVDGTDAAQGDVQLDKILPIITDIIELLVNGKSVLIACNNGADRSATLVCMVLMRLLSWSSSQASAYLATMRNIVDLKSRAPPSRGRAQMVRPVDFLEKIEEALHAGSARENAKAAIGFVPLRRKALELGFEARFAAGRTSLLTRVDRKSSSDEGETTQSYDMGTDAENSDGTFLRCRAAGSMAGSASWLFVESPASTPRSGSAGEGSELRRRKLRMLIEDLTDLTLKLENHVSSSGGFEPGLTLKDASGHPAAVVVGDELSLTAAPASASAEAGAPQASLAGQQAKEPSLENKAGEPNDEPDPKKAKVEGDAAPAPGAEAPAEEATHGSKAAPAVDGSKEGAAPDGRPANFPSCCLYEALLDI